MLYIFRGLPGCGKSTRAREMQKSLGGIVVERDEIRYMLFGTYYDPAIVDEKLVTEYQNALIEMSLQMRMTVFVSDMNLRNSYVKTLVEKAWKFNSEYDIIDMTDVSLELCVLNNKSDERYEKGKVVDEDVIIELYRRFIRGSIYPLPLFFTGAKVTEAKREQYVPDTTRNEAVIVDIDGTIARMHNRGPFEEGKVIDDLPIKNVIKMVENAMMNDITVIFMSGRTDACREDTLKWLKRELPWLAMTFGDVDDFSWELHMRRSVEDRGRPDDDVKYDLFMKHVATRYNVLYVLDDRDKVVKMWREIGLTCAQVAEGNF